jgi:hypothetical protein
MAPVVATRLPMVLKETLYISPRSWQPTSKQGINTS